mgnify:FL=1
MAEIAFLYLFITHLLLGPMNKIQKIYVRKAVTDCIKYGYESNNVGCKGMFWYKFKIYTPNVCQQYTFSCKKTGKLDIF